MRAYSHCMRTLPAECRPNAPWITSARPRLTSQPSADHLPRTLRPCLPVLSFRHLLRLWRRRDRRAHRTRSGTVFCRSNAAQIDPGRACVAKKCACEYCMTARAGPGAGPAGTRACLTSMSPVWGMYMSRGMHQCIDLSDCFCMVCCVCVSVKFHVSVIFL